MLYNARNPSVDCGEVLANIFPMVFCLSKFSRSDLKCSMCLLAFFVCVFLNLPKAGKASFENVFYIVNT